MARQTAQNGKPTAGDTAKPPVIDLPTGNPPAPFR